MPDRSTLHRDLLPLAFAAFATLVLSVAVPVASPNLQSSDTRVSTSGPVPTVPTVDIRAAERTGAWWLDARHVTVHISFAPEYEHFVWRVEADKRTVLLDVATGEALEFEFE
jgi:hypothetical protein